MRLALPRRVLRVASDERLVAQVRAGSRTAFEVVYDRHHGGILAFCRHMLGSREEAEDVVQHTFAAAYQALLAEDQREIALKAWLYAIARNRCVSVLRVRREHVALEDAEPRLPSTVGLSAEVEQRAELRSLLNDLQLLPDEQRAALVLAELGAQSHEEIALILDVPSVKVKALIFQARETLMSRRVAREADCRPIREQLAVLRGGARRRSELRHHVAQCEGCRMFEAEVRRQRSGMAVLLPVVPTLALKKTSLAAAFAGGGSGAVAVGGGAVGGAAAGSAAAGSAAAGSAAAGSAGAGSVAAGAAATGAAATGAAATGGAATGAAATGAAATGGAAAAAGGAASAGGSAALTSGGALFGAKLIGAKAVIALAVTGVAGGGYVAVKELPTDPPAAQHAQATPARLEQIRRPEGKPPAGVVPAGAGGECSKGGTVPAACTHGSSAKADRHPGATSNSAHECAATPCPDNASANQAFAAKTPADRDGDRILNRQDTCPNKPAHTANGCPDSAPADPVPGAPPSAARIPGDRDGDGLPNRQDTCPNKPASTGNGCPDATPADPTPNSPPARDRDGDGVPNRQDTCPNVPANTPNGCPDPTPADPTPTDPNASAPPTRDRDGDGVPNRQDGCPTIPATTPSGCPDPTPPPSP
ncbi:MAG TPA: sigma-70 family RNA polymerase sigma factor [Solirubrobacteraceae bacterium]|jgi:RNA polymerase sigma factor (sigma-70 family)